jgi:hypothetical protein
VQLLQHAVPGVADPHDVADSVDFRAQLMNIVHRDTPLVMPPSIRYGFKNFKNEMNTLTDKAGGRIKGARLRLVQAFGSNLQFTLLRVIRWQFFSLHFLACRAVSTPASRGYRRESRLQTIWCSSLLSYIPSIISNISFISNIWH